MPIAQIPVASRGLTGERDPSHLKTGDLYVANNIDLSAGTLLQKSGGFTKADTTSTYPIISGIEWIPLAGVNRRIVATTEGKIYRNEKAYNASSVMTSIYSGRPFNQAQMIEAGTETDGRNRKLFVITGENDIQVISGDGLVTTSISDPPNEWTGANQPRLGFMFRNSFTAGGTPNDPHRIYGSQVVDHEAFSAGTGDFTLSVYPGESERLVAGIASISRGFLWKYPLGIYWINDSDSNSDNWFVQPATYQFGAAPTPHAVTQVDKGTVAFISQVGDIILMQETAGSLSGVEFVNLVKALNLRDFMRQNFNLGRLDRAQLKWYEDKKQLWVLLSALGSIVNDRALVIDFNEERTRVSVINTSYVGGAESMWFEKDGQDIYRPVLGIADGDVYRADVIDRTIPAGQGTVTEIPFELVTAPTDFSDINVDWSVKKLFYRLHLESEPTGDYNITARIIVDRKVIGTVTFNQSDPNTAVLPQNLPFTLGGDNLLRRSRDIGGEGYYFSVGITDSSGHNPRLARLWVEFDLLEHAR